ncbi:DISARM system SNF2-like helicase DrmD [Streptomyces hirsutus]|uniref:DISARM system SNF2-like helicase DrmD n=1 Tax=Streptomyces hirsutus TaxID=35620 RepID=UPI003867FAE8|nr:DISARM system SNF2-like helicase DrmD [Streptomyces hirsutus]
MTTHSTKPEDSGNPSAPVPAPGQRVTVRHRPWVVTDVVRSTAASDDPARAAGAAPTHLVKLSSLESDGRDEELRVVWELEQATDVHDAYELPSPEHGFDDPGRLDAFLDAVRWGAIASADKTALQAPFRSGVEIQDYQLDPVVRALSMPRTNLLIADDVGLGKTVEAGLVMQELMLRHRARSMLIVCPAGLTLQWRDEMRDKFGLDFRIVDTKMLRELRRAAGPHANPWTHHPRLIVSIDWLKRERPLRMLREVLPQVPDYPRAFDLLVVDEVHTCAPSGTGRYAVDSQRTRAVKLLAPHCEHRLFLSATPHNGFLNSFTALLEMLDPNRFAVGVRPTDEQLKRVMVRRMKSELPPLWNGKDRFPRRVPHALEIDHSDEAREAYAKLAEYARLRRGDQNGAKAGRTAADFVTTLLKKRFLSSPKAFAETVATHLKTMTSRRDTAEEAPAPSVRVLRPLIDGIEEAEEADEQEQAEVAERALTAARQAMRTLTEREHTLLKELDTWAAEAGKRPDAKFERFRRWLDEIVCPAGPKGDWEPQRVIVFTEYRDTQRWLYGQLLAAGYPADRIAQLHGGQDRDEREHVKQVFQESPDLSPVRILLGTDAASEGINLQAHCHRVLHWEIPWNPNRLEQRNGRVDRHGQKAKQVDVYHFVPQGWQGFDPAHDSLTDSGFEDGALEDELHFLAVAARKTERIREDLGSAGEVIAAQVEQKMLGRRSSWTTADAEITKRSGRAVLKVERDLARDLERLVGALTDSRQELHLNAETVERVVRTGLLLGPGKDLTEVSDPQPKLGARCFRLPELTGAWARARNDGLRHPLTGKERLVVFDETESRDRTDVIHLHLGHRLVQMCLRLLRAQLWRTRGLAKLSRVTARVVPDGVLRQPALVAHGRVVITGSGGTRLHEEVIAVGGLIDGGKLSVAKKDEVEAWLAAATEELPADEVRAEVTSLWSQLEERLRGALKTQANRRFRSLETLLAKRCEEEVEGMRAVLEDLRQSIRDRLDEKEYWAQDSLFKIDDERDQLHADREALQERWKRLPEVIETETAALRRRWADPSHRWFPVAVTFLVPRSLSPLATPATARQENR